MENIKQEDLIKKDSASETEETTEQTQEEAVVDEQDPLKEELERVRSKKSERTELEKALYKRDQIDARIKELKGEEEEESPVQISDDAPVTLGMLKKIEQEKATKAAISLVDSIENETERELTKYHLQNSIQPSGDPETDFRRAQAIVNSARNSKIAEEASRKGVSKSHSSGGGADARYKAPEAELTEQEMLFMKKPFNMTKAEIIAARKQ